MTINVPAGSMPPPPIVNVTIPQPGTIANAGTYTSEAIGLYGFRHVAVTAQLTNAGTLSLQRYVDLAATVTAGAAVTAAMSASTTATIDNLGTVIAQSAKVSIINGGTTAGTISALAMVLAPD